MTADDALLRIEVVHAVPDRAWRVRLQLPPGATVAQALHAADLPSQVQGLVVDPARLAIFGRIVGLAEPLRDGDRVEILRPLPADPMQARRTRARQEHARREKSARAGRTQ